MSFTNTYDEIGSENLTGKLLDGSLEELKSNHITKIAQYGLAYSPIKYMDFPNLTSWGNIASNALVCSGYDFKFYGTSISGSSGILQSTIDTLRLPNITSITGTSLNNYFLRKIVIGTNETTSVATLSTAPSSALSNTPFIRTNSHGNAYVFVPDDLVEDYKVATNWSTIADKIKPLSDFSDDYWGDDSYIQDSWDTICSNINAGNYSQYLKKKKFLLIPKVGWAYMVCIAIDTGELEGGGVPKTTWFVEDLVGVYRRMNPPYVANMVGTGTRGGYNETEMKNDYIPEIEDNLPTILKTNIKSVKKITYVYRNSSNVQEQNQESYVKVFPGSYRELFGGTSYESTGEVYTDIFTDNNSRIKYGYSGAYDWWLRSSNTDDYIFRMVYSSGFSSFNGAGGTSGIAFGFCI